MRHLIIACCLLAGCSHTETRQASPQEPLTLWAIHGHNARLQAEAATGLVASLQMYDVWTNATALGHSLFPKDGGHWLWV